MLRCLFFDRTKATGDTKHGKRAETCRGQQVVGRRLEVLHSTLATLKMAP